MADTSWWGVAGAVCVVVAVVVAAGRLAFAAGHARRARAREVAAGVAQYGLLFGFAAVAAAISAHGLFGFARVNMGLGGPWPYLLWGALDGAAGLCAVLLMRRAARGESAAAPRLAVALMPVIAAVLFEFSLRETRHLAAGTRRRLAGLGWLRPGERIRAWLMLSADGAISAETATHRVRVDCAARRLTVLRQVQAARDRAPVPAVVAGCRVRRAERRAQSALVRVRFTDPIVAAEVLRQVQVLTLTSALATLDYTTPDHAQAALASLIASGHDRLPATSPSGGPVLARWSCTAGGAADAVRLPARSLNGHGPGPPDCAALACHACDRPGSGQAECMAAAAGTQADSRATARGDRLLADAAARIVAQTRRQGGCLSQAELARQLRGEGYSIANGRLRWLSAVSGLQPDPESG
jgi:hypothetical protein